MLRPVLHENNLQAALNLIRLYPPPALEPSHLHRALCALPDAAMGRQASQGVLFLWSIQDPPRNMGVDKGLKRGLELNLISLAWPMNKHQVSTGPQLSEQTCPGHRLHTMPTF